MRRFKTVEELNMETVVELTVEEKTQAFEQWVDERMERHEMGLSSVVGMLDNALEQGIPLFESKLDNEFSLRYFFINKDVEIASVRCVQEHLSEDLRNRALSEFKQMKLKARKTKAEYKKKFMELREAIELAKADEDYVNKIRNQVQGIITEWCNTYVLHDYCKERFEADELPNTVAYVVDSILSKKLNPSDADVENHVKNYMEHNTETVAVAEVKYSQEYSRCEVEVRGICNSVNNLIWSVQSILTDIIPAETLDEVRHLYIDSLMKAIHFAIEDVEKLIQKNNVTDENEVNSLKSMIAVFLDSPVVECVRG
ncbi:MAG: hypothetical protein IIX48_12875 [Lachnospiraceae bacterium]|nr:hypothetical protein [Lachnospiraceae bacterium]